MRHHPRRSRRKGQCDGQSLVELSLAIPFLLLLLLGGAQVGIIMYGSITVATAAREGGRVASIQPINSKAYSAGGTPIAGTYHCLSADTDPVCVAVRQSSGLLTGSSFDTTIAPDTTWASASVSAGTCPSPATVHDGAIKVTVFYDVPVILPFVGNFFDSPANPGHYRATQTVEVRVAPCTLTQGN